MDENSKLDDPKDARDVTMEAMVQSALRSAELAVGFGMRPEQIILSAKVSGVQDLIDVYRRNLRGTLQLCPSSQDDRGRYGR